MNQAADVPENRRERPGAAGHGCGHNPSWNWRHGGGLPRIRDWLCRPVQKVQLSFTLAVRLEEGGAWKGISLTRSGCFHGLDFALAWHPGSKTGLDQRGARQYPRGSLTLPEKSAHAAAHLELGCSALDALRFMNVVSTTCGSMSK